MQMTSWLHMWAVAIIFGQLVAQGMQQPGTIHTRDGSVSMAANGSPNTSAHVRECQQISDVKKTLKYTVWLLPGQKIVASNCRWLSGSIQVALPRCSCWGYMAILPAARDLGYTWQTSHMSATPCSMFIKSGPCPQVHASVQGCSRHRPTTRVVA